MSRQRKVWRLVCCQREGGLFPRPLPDGRPVVLGPFGGVAFGGVAFLVMFYSLTVKVE